MQKSCKKAYEAVVEDALHEASAIAEDDEEERLALRAEAMDPAADLDALAAVLLAFADLDLDGGGERGVLDENDLFGLFETARFLLGLESSTRKQGKKAEKEGKGPKKSTFWAAAAAS